MCLTPLIKISPWRQIQINGYCYYRGDLDTGILPRILFLSAESHETWPWIFISRDNLNYQDSS